MPNKFHHYYNLIRLGSPTGYLLVFFPSAFGILLASTNLNGLKIIPLFFAGSILIRSAGCIINDIIDRNLDKHVERTKMRPIASGAISVKESLLVLYILLFICLAILLSLTLTSIMIGFIAFCLIIIYPLMKRTTHFPQVFLGITFNLGCLIGYAAINDHISCSSVLLYLGCCFWTIGYDTIYAFMDIKDDKIIGIKSTAIFFEKQYYCLWIILFYMIFILLYVNVNLVRGYYIGAFGGIIVIPVLLWQVKTLDINSIENCASRFKSNNYVGFILFISMFINCIYHANL